MRTTFVWASCVIALTFACKDTSSAKAPPSQPPPTPSQVFPMKPLEAPPKQSDLDAKAGNDINESNADAEYEKLKNEIEGGGKK